MSGNCMEAAAAAMGRCGIDCHSSALYGSDVFFQLHSSDPVLLCCSSKRVVFLFMLHSLSPIVCNFPKFMIYCFEFHVLDKDQSDCGVVTTDRHNHA